MFPFSWIWNCALESDSRGEPRTTVTEGCAGRRALCSGQDRGSPGESGGGRATPEPVRSRPGFRSERRPGARALPHPQLRRRRSPDQSVEPAAWVACSPRITASCAVIPTLIAVLAAPTLGSTIMGKKDPKKNEESSLLYLLLFIPFLINFITNPACIRPINGQYIGPHRVLFLLYAYEILPLHRSN